jgi:2-polyprenyl-6-methoxyphenol hydroxylase-like FAD-dependent oxidoreductase
MTARSTAVAIIGAGFSGTMVAANLARRGIDSLLIEPRDLAGKGTAF